MQLDDVLFVGGPWPKFASVQIRCVDIATYLGCAYVVNARSIENVPGRYKGFICVKTRLPDEDLSKLARRGPILWDVIDGFPDEQKPISRLIVSTEAARLQIKYSVETDVIYHYHCNLEGVLNSPELRRPVWVGGIQWYPEITVEHDVFDVTGRSRLQVVAAYRQMGVGLNLRARRPGYEQHAILNSGIKLINSMGFGVPSVSEREPPYLEVDADCTLFTNMANYADAVKRLHEDVALYEKLRSNCLDQARRFNISSIAEKYRQVIASL